MAQRISRAKQRIKAAGVHSACRRSRSGADRLTAVLHVLYLIFNEGYTSAARARTCTGRPDRGGDPADPRACTGCCPTTARWPGCSR